MNAFRFTLAAALLASAAATAATSAFVQDESDTSASLPLRLLGDLTPADGRPVPAFDLPLVVRDIDGNVVLDARSEGPFPLARLARSMPEEGQGASQPVGERYLGGSNDRVS